MDITPGSTITVNIVKQPTNAAASKTLVRVLSKDPAIVAENKRLKKVRAKNAKPNQRGGRVRLWAGRLVKQHPIKGQLGESGTLVASPDVIKDLASVERFIEVKAA